MSDKLLSNSFIADKTSVSIPFLLITSAGADVTGKVAADLTAYYWRQGGTFTSISLSNLAALNSAYSSGGVKEGQNGLYRLDLPDAALASGVDWVVVLVICSGAISSRTQYAIESAGTVEIYSRVGAPAGASVSADIAGVQSDTDNIQTRIPAALTADGNIKADALKLNGATPNNLAQSSILSDATPFAGANVATINTNVSTLLSRLGAFTGTGVNTVLGFLRAMANKAVGVTTPSDLSSGGTFTNITDSLEAIADGQIPGSPIVYENNITEVQVCDT